LVKVPTAVQAVAEAHATARSWLVPLVGIGGAFCTVQLTPSQRSAKGWLSLEPTAMHADSEMHETPSSDPAGGTLVTLWMVQLTPSQRSASGP
jgi:hypothetical protein